MRQQIYDVLPGRPFGRGTTTTTYSSDPNTRTYATSTGAVITLGSAILQDGDLAAIHQTYGVASATEENWELFVVASGGGTTTITAESALGRTYTTGAQVIKVPETLNLTISSGFGGHAYGASVTTGNGNAFGGINIIAVKNKLTLTATIHQNGYQGYINTADHSGLDTLPFWNWWYSNAPSGGHVGGWNSVDGGAAGVGGNLSVGFSSAEQRAAIENGGGAGWSNDQAGGGGGNGTAGSWASDGGGAGAGTAGNAALTSMHLGGGGGGPKGSSAGGGIWTGSSGGGIWIIFCREIEISGGGGIQANAGIAYGNNDVEGGGGAGGSILINCQKATLGTGLVQANYNTVYGSAGVGGVGRIRVNYGASVTGTTTPSASTNNNTLLNPLAGSALFSALV